MDQVLSGLIGTVLMESVKILGPAIVTAIVTYKLTKIQYDGKLKEIDKSNEFKARERLFDYYKERQDKLAADHMKLNETFGQIAGISSHVADGKGELDGFAEMAFGIYDLYLRTAPFEAEVTLRDMVAKNLDKTKEYFEIDAYKMKLAALKPTRDMSEIKHSLFLLMEFYMFLLRSNHLLLERQLESVFEKYVSKEQ